MDFGKVITAMVTPFDENLNVDFKALERLVEHLINTGTDTILVAGTTGESPTLTDQEKVELFKVTKSTADGRAKIMAGTGSNDTRHSIKLSQAADKIGVDGLLLVTPYYNKPTQEGLYRHFKMIADEVDTPIVLYNVPGRTGATIEPDTIARLSEVKNIVALKEAGGNLDKTSMTRCVAPNLTVYSGDDSLTLPMLSLGAKGVISVASHVVGKQIKEMIESFEAGDIKKAEKIHLDIFDVFKGLFIITNPIPVKEAVNMIGIEVGGFRPPLTGADEKTKKYLKNLLTSHGLI